VSSRVGDCALLLLLLGCGSAEHAAEQKSAAQLARAIELLRQAPNEAKAAPLSALAQLPCTGAEVCATRAACSAAYGLHVEATSLTAAAKLLLADDKPAEAGRLLNSAQQKLADASAKVSDCTAREGALRRLYKL
jgi:hypothetical protein